MTTWIVRKEQVDVNFTLKELQDFSNKYTARVIVKDFCIFQAGGVVWLKN